MKEPEKGAAEQPITRSTGKRGIHIHHPQAASLSLVLHKLLELRPGPAVQAGTHSPAHPDALAKVQVVVAFKAELSFPRNNWTKQAVV